MTLFVLRLATALAVILSYSVTIAAQGGKTKQKPDLTGTWQLDVTKTKSGQLVSRSDLPLKIAHTDPEFRVIISSESDGQIVERESIYFTDDRGETNQAISMITAKPYTVKPENQRAKSKTKWRDNKIIVRSSFPATADGRVIALQIVEWQLSSDGKMLTQTTRVFVQHNAGNSVFVPGDGREFKLVYNLISK